MFVGSDHEWVAWTPQGYYTSSLQGDRYIGWHLNQGEDKAAKYYSASQFQKQFYRPDVVAEYLKSRDIQVAVQRANAERGGDVSWTTGHRCAGCLELSATVPQSHRPKARAEHC